MALPSTTIARCKIKATLAGINDVWGHSRNCGKYTPPPVSMRKKFKGKQDRPRPVPPKWKTPALGTIGDMVDLSRSK